MLPGGGVSVAVAFILLLLASAKAHGRQVRLERERHGVMSVDFRRDNGPVVETIWRQDRIRFWVSAGAVGALLTGLAWLGLAFAAWPRVGAVAIALAWGFCAGFIGAGLTQWLGQMRPRPDDPDWMERAQWGSFGWWALVAAALALVWVAVR